MEFGAKKQRTRIVVPFPEIDPEFSVEYRILNDDEQARILDKAGLNLRKPTAEQSLKAGRALALAAITKVNHLEEEGMVLDSESKETKKKFIEATVHVDGAEWNLWAWCQKLGDEQSEEEAKN
jgi:hypothetical protein